MSLRAAADSFHPEEPITEAQPEPQPGEPADIGPAGPMEEVPVYADAPPSTTQPEFPSVERASIEQA